MAPTRPNWRRENSPTYRYANLVLDNGLDSIVRAARAEGKGWRVIARDLWLRTNGQVDITHETLRRWYEANGEAA